MIKRLIKLWIYRKYIKMGIITNEQIGVGGIKNQEKVKSTLK